jgi:DNA-binding MarR family transcriptional regulator
MSDTEHTSDRAPLMGLLDAATEAYLGQFRRELEETGYADIRPTHGCVFRFVRDDGMRLTELAAHAGMTKQSVGEIVDDLVEHGYVERFPDPADRRAKLIRLTEKGVEAQRVGFGLIHEIEGRWAERFGDERVAELRETLEGIVAELAPHAVPELARERAQRREATREPAAA